jgi:hypothetical protein
MRIDAETQLNKPDGVTIDVDSEGALYAKTATGGTLGKPGIVKPDGSTVTILADGTISAVQSSYSLPIASTSTLGGVKSDGSTINITSGGVISAVGGGSGRGVPFAGSSTQALTFPTYNTPVTAVAPQDCWGMAYGIFSRDVVLSISVIINGNTRLFFSTDVSSSAIAIGGSLPIKKGQTLRVSISTNATATSSFCGWVFPDAATGSGAGSSIEAMTQAHRPYKLSDIPIWIEYKSDLEYAIEHFFNIAAITIEVLLNDMVGGEKREAMGLTVEELRDMQAQMGISL